MLNKRKSVMEQKKNGNDYTHLLQNLSRLPRKIIALHEFDNVTEYVLHELCNSDCFNIIKAAYFVDNPDFDCFRGVAGYAQDEQFEGDESVVNDPSVFTKHLEHCAFNQKVRETSTASIKRSEQKDHELIEQIAQKLGLEAPSVRVWSLKHGNQGLLIFVHGQDLANQDEAFNEHLENGLHMLGFCPVG